MAVVPPPPVLIAGAGPVGLLTALALCRHGVPVRVLERRRDRPHGSRASTLQPPVLDRLAELGLLPALAARGQRVERIAAWDLERGERRELDLALVAGRTAHPHRLHLELPHLMAALERRLAELAPGCLVRGLEAIGWDRAGPAGEGGTARLLARDAEGTLRSLEGSWLVAADGAHSSLRQAAGLAFLGQDEAAPVVRLSVRRLPGPLERQLAPLTYLRSGERSLSFLRMVDGWRVILRPAAGEVAAALACPPTAGEGQLSEASPWALERLQAALEAALQIAADTAPKAEAGGDGQAQGQATDQAETTAAEQAWPGGPIGQEHYPVRRRRVERHRLGRLLLIGDAAHVTNTRGGLNMNFGLLEGLALAEALAHWWHGRRPAGGEEHTAAAGAVGAWAARWQQLTATVLLPRTASMEGAGTLFDLAPGAPDSGRSHSRSGGERNGQAELEELLVRATLLDLAPPQDPRP